MKKYIFSILALIVVLGSGLLIIEGCKLKNPVEGVGVTIKPSAVGAPNVFRVVDIASGYSELIFENAIVTISGRDAPFLYSADAERTIKIIQGQFGVSV